MAPGRALRRTLLMQVLIANFFFILFVLLWFVAGIGESAALQSSNLLNVWYPLWPLVFQPALGVLMLGALVSGAAGKLAEGKEDGTKR